MTSFFIFIILKELFLYIYITKSYTIHQHHIKNVQTKVQTYLDDNILARHHSKNGGGG